MPKDDKTYEQDLADLVRSIDDARDEAARTGPVDPDDARQMLDDAVARGLQRRRAGEKDLGKRAQAAGRAVIKG